MIRICPMRSALESGMDTLIFRRSSETSYPELSRHITSFFDAFGISGLENPLDLEFPLSDSSRFIPVYLSAHNLAAFQKDFRDSLPLSPAPTAMGPSQSSHFPISIS